MNLLEKEKLKRKATSGLMLEAFKIEIEEYFLNIKHKKDKLFSFEEVEILPKEKISGVYLIYGENEQGICFTYIGESNDIYNRWKQHKKNIVNKNNGNSYKTLRKRISSKNYKNIKFKILEIIEDPQKRYYRETYHLLMTKNKFLSVNRKHCSRSMLCQCIGTKKHGVSKAYLVLSNSNEKIEKNIYGYSKNKLCRTKIFIN